MKHYKFNQNKECEYFPCHKGVPDEEFNCLFCYCPLYMLGKECGGNFFYNRKNIKDCSLCIKPHDKGSYDYVMENMKMVIERTKKK